jgi:hypothetical protein
VGNDGAAFSTTRVGRVLWDGTGRRSSAVRSIIFSAVGKLYAAGRITNEQRYEILRGNIAA